MTKMEIANTNPKGPERPTPPVAPPVDVNAALEAAIAELGIMGPGDLFSNPSQQAAAARASQVLAEEEPEVELPEVELDDEDRPPAPGHEDPATDPALDTDPLQARVRDLEAQLAALKGPKDAAAAEAPIAPAPRSLDELGQRLMPQLLADAARGADGVAEWEALSQDEVIVLTPAQMSRMMGNLLLTVTNMVVKTTAPLNADREARAEDAKLAAIGVDRAGVTKLVKEHPWLATMSGEARYEALKSLAAGAPGTVAKAKDQNNARQLLDPARMVEVPSIGGGSMAPAGGNMASLDARRRKAVAAGDKKLADALMDKMIKLDSPVGQPSSMFGG